MEIGETIYVVFEGSLINVPSIKKETIKEFFKTGAGQEFVVLESGFCINKKHINPTKNTDYYDYVVAFTDQKNADEVLYKFNKAWLRLCSERIKEIDTEFKLLREEQVKLLVMQDELKNKYKL